jgi:methylphosphotriester-DNA--protein-cysteine methyltransferase
MSTDKQIWFESASEALDNGYRPCKLCYSESISSKDMNLREQITIKPEQRKLLIENEREKSVSRDSWQLIRERPHLIPAVMGAALLFVAVAP